MFAPQQMLDQIKRYIEQHALASPGTSVLAGVSGGIDSMVLLNVLQALHYSVVCAHVNYRMRDAASDADEALVTGYCRQHNIPCFIHRVSDAFLSASGSVSFQEAARNERYTFFQHIAAEEQIAQIAVAHHLDDQVETVLMHLMRGSGVEGLAGMSPSRPLAMDAGIKLIRPLLSTTRDQIREYATYAEIVWREDISNQSTKYLRNKMRHGLIADIRKSFGEGAVKNIARSAEYMGGYAEATILPALAAKFKALSLPDAGLDIPGLQAEHPVWQERIILAALEQWLPDTAGTRKHASAIRQLLDVQVGRYVIIKGATVWRDRSALRFVPAESSRPEYLDLNDPEPMEYLLSQEDAVTFSEGTLELSLLNQFSINDLKCTPEMLLADVDKLQFPLVLRRWRAGDRFVPFGMKGQKKVSDLLTDLKVPPHKKSDVWVLASDDEIIWVVGYRAGASMQIREETTRVLQGRLSRS